MNYKSEMNVLQGKIDDLYEQTLRLKDENVKDKELMHSATSELTNKTNTISQIRSQIYDQKNQNDDQMRFVEYKLQTKESEVKDLKLQLSE